MNSKRKNQSLLGLIFGVISLGIGLLFYNLAYSVDIPFPTTHAVDGNFSGARSVYDGDGDPDVAGAAHDGDEIAWWENSSGDATTWTEHVVSSVVDGAVWVEGGDYDMDGDLDLPAAAGQGHEISWWENSDSSGAGG